MARTITESGSRGEARVTMRGVILRTALLPLALVVLVACGDGKNDAAATTEELRSVQEQADAALASVDELTETVAGLDERLESELSDRDDQADKLRRVVKRLKDALGRLRGEVADARGSASAASGDVASALARIAEMERDLSVLTDRLDVHLKRGDG